MGFGAIWTFQRRQTSLFWRELDSYFRVVILTELSRFQNKPIIAADDDDDDIKSKLARNGNARDLYSRHDRFESRPRSQIIQTGDFIRFPQSLVSYA